MKTYKSTHKVIYVQQSRDRKMDKLMLSLDSIAQKAEESVCKWILFTCRHTYHLNKIICVYEKYVCLGVLHKYQ